MIRNSLYTTSVHLGIVLAFAIFSLSASAEIHILSPDTTGAHTLSHPDLSGYWVLNEEQSDDFREKMKDAMEEARDNRRGNAKNGMGGGSGRGKGGKGKGHGGGKRAGSGMGHGGSGPGLQGVQALLAAREVLDIKHQDPMLLIITGDGRTQRLFTDYRGMSISASGAIQQKLSTAGWEGNSLVVETTDNNGLRLLQRYQLDAQLFQLKVDTEILLPSQAAPVHIITVYDADSAGVDR